MFDDSVLDFEWDQGNLGHITRHGVDPSEVEEAFANSDWLIVGNGVWHPSGELRYPTYGRTESGRVLEFVFIQRGRLIRVVTAHTMKKNKRVEYEKTVKERRQSGGGTAETP